MRTMTGMLMAVALCATGCSPAYRVHVNSFSELGGPPDKTTPVFVATDPNARNPILRKQIEAKIRSLLQDDGYRPVETMAASSYVLTFRVGIDSERMIDYAPMYRPFFGFHGGHFGGFGGGYTVYTPYIDTIYSDWLEMKLYGPQGQGAAERQVVWEGEAVTGTDQPDLRDAVNYLLVGCLEHFGADTGKWISMTIKKDDPRVQSIAGIKGEETP